MAPRHLFWIGPIMGRFTVPGGRMGCIITVASSKGGAGKTAVTTCLAINLAAQGYRIAVIDAESQCHLLRLAYSQL